MVYVILNHIGVVINVTTKFDDAVRICKGNLKNYNFIKTGHKLRTASMIVETTNLGWTVRHINSKYWLNIEASRLRQ